MFRINKNKLRESHEGVWLLVDFFMLGLLLLNLLFIIFDTLYTTAFFKNALAWMWQDFPAYYQPVHDNFVLVDLGFIAVFLTEFIIRWVVAVRRKTYMRWYFFPVAHWYDLIGCIPLSGTRIFRFLRIFSILYRLHKYQIIDFNQLGAIRFVRFYYDALIEELSDRIVVKVLSDVQKEVVVDSPLMADISAQVIKPRKDALNHWLSNMLAHIGEHIDDAQKGAVIREHVEQSVSLAVRENSQVSTLNLVPVLGSSIEKILEVAVADIVIQSIVHLLKDMSPAKVDSFMQHTVHQRPDDEMQINQEVLDMVVESIDIVKAHVGTQRWKVELEASSSSLNTDK